MATTIDTLKIYERLKGADLSDKAAKEIAEVVRESSELSSMTKEAIKEELTKELVTKTDLKDLLIDMEKRFATKAELAETKAELLKWMFIFWASQIGIIVALIKFLK
ncbi:MAG: hypothetical protein HQK88_07980 [Nitrospirae bacterium]|nr:hypothetical protein [Nitrospirota bacterium]MBF0533609.1 hypothetical protein [Nitrospirota bacterium]MBF0616740.1 hypothetical protein [Nitrospirota bacterium]